MILLSINFVLLTMFKVREEQIHFWFCWYFSPTGPMHLISALSLWAGTLWAKSEGVLQLPDSTKWRAWIYEHKHTGDTRHSGNHCPKMLEDVNYINNNKNNYYNRPQQNQGWNQQRPNYSERQSRTLRHPDLHRHGGLPRITQIPQLLLNSLHLRRPAIDHGSQQVLSLPLIMICVRSWLQ